MASKKVLPLKIRIKNKRSFIWLLLVLFNLAVAQIWLYFLEKSPKFDQPPWMATILIGLAVVALLAALSLQWRTTEDLEAGFDITITWSWLPMIVKHSHWAALFGGVLVTFLILWRIPQQIGDINYTAIFLAWAVAIGLSFWAIVPKTEWNWTGWLRQRDKQFWSIVALMLFALLLRLWRIGTLPFTLSGDEASQGLEAVRVIEGVLRNPFTTGWLGVPTMSFFFNSYSLRLFGRTITALRLPWGIVGASTVLVTFLLVKQMYGRRLGWITAVLLATYHYHIHYSRLGSNQIADPLFLALALLFLMRALDNKKRLDWALLGLVTGLAFYFYAGARLTPIVITAVLGYHFILNPRRFWQDHHKGVIIAIWVFMIVAAPMLQYAVRFPNDFNARLNEVGILQNGWLLREVETSGKSFAAVLFDQFQRAIFAFNYYSDRTEWYGLRTPLLDPFFGGLFLLGLLYGTSRLFTPKIGRRLAPMIAWWWGGILLGGMMTLNPPSSQRLITAAVPTCFLLALAMCELLRVARDAFGRLPERAILMVAVIAFAFISLKTYFIDYTRQQIYGGPNAELATTIAPLLNELKYNHRIQFVGSPWMYWGFATLPYLVPHAIADDVPEVLPDPLPNFQLLDKGIVFIVIPHRQADLEDIIVPAYPDGVRREIYSSVNGRLMVTLYQIPPPR